MKRDPRSSGLLAVCLAASSWGTWPLIVRHGGQSGLVVGFLTMLVMSLPALGLFRQWRFDDRGAVGALVIIGIADAANVALYFSALEAGPVVVAVLTHYLAPVLVALAAPALIGEARSHRAPLALPAMLLGLFLVLPSWSEAGKVLTAATFGSLSAVAYASLVLATRRAARTFSPLAVTSFHSVVSATLLLVVLGSRVIPTSLDGGTLILLAGAAVNGLLGAFLFNVGLPKIGAQLTGVLTYLEPLVASLLGLLLLKEPASPSTFAGLGLMVSAGAWMALEPPRSLD